MRIVFAICAMALIASGALCGDTDNDDIQDLGEDLGEGETTISVANAVADIVSNNHRNIGEGGGESWNQNAWMRDIANVECVQLPDGPKIHEYCFNRTEDQCNGDKRDWFCDFDGDENCDSRNEGECRKINTFVASTGNSPGHSGSDDLIPAKCCIWDAAASNCTYSDGNTCM